LWHGADAIAGLCGTRQSPDMASISADDPPPVAPSRPDDNACCGNGCEPCIFDLFAELQARYAEELRAWQARQAQRGGGNPSAPPGVSFSDS
jgi:hypothetical protein